MVSPASSTPAPGRGTALNPANRFEHIVVAPDPDFGELDEHGVPVPRPHPKTQFFHDATESLLTHNDSPDVGPGWGLNAYRGCEHVMLAYIYCSALLSPFEVVIIELVAPEDRSDKACRRERPIRVVA